MARDIAGRRSKTNREDDKHNVVIAAVMKLG